MLLAGAVLAQNDNRKKPAPGPFDMPPPGFAGWEGARARYYEEIERFKVRIERNPANADALERALDLCDELGRTRLLVETARRAAQAKEIDDASRLRNRGVLGRTLVALSNSMGTRGNFIRILNGRIIQTVSDEQKKILTEAIDHLRAAVKRDRTRPALRYALAEALETLQADAEEENKEAAKLRDEAESIATRDARIDVATGPYAKQAEGLVARAAEIEQAKEDPDHVRALELRKKAVVFWFCRDTIVFDFAPGLYQPVSQLAPRHIVFDTLTRTYLNRKGEVDEVVPNYHGAPLAKKMGLIEGLGKEQSNGADAALLALVRGSQLTHDVIADAAAKVLAQKGHDAARRGLPLLLAKALYARETQRFPIQGQRRLIDLAATLKLAGAAPVLVELLQRDNDLRWPRGVAAALARTGRPEHADALKKIALDTARALHFRREAARAFALLAIDRAGELDAHAELEIALAAARYEKAPDESTLGRLLNGLADDLEVDEAARYCAELRIAEARPAMDAFLARYGEKRDHPARLDVEHARKRLNAEG